MTVKGYIIYYIAGSRQQPEQEMNYKTNMIIFEFCTGAHIEPLNDIDKVLMRDLNLIKHS